jgi:hypothetical protein
MDSPSDRAVGGAMIRIFRRAAIIAFCCLNAAYAFLAASSFSYQDFIRSKMFGTGIFSRAHVPLFWLWFLLTIVDLRHAMVCGERGRLMAIGFAAVWGIVGTVLTVHPLLPALRDDHYSLMFGLVALVPLIWLAAIVHRRHSAFLAWPRLDRTAMDSRWLVAAVGTAVFMPVLYATMTPLAMRGAFEPDLLTTGLVTGLLWNIASHLLIFSAAYLVMALVLHASASSRIGWQYAATFATVAAGIALSVQRGVCNTLGFGGAWSMAVAVGCAVAISATWAALRLDAASRRGDVLTSPLDVFFGAAPARPLGTRDLAPMVGIVIAAFGIAAVSRAIDWDFLLLKSGIFALWLATFAYIARRTPPMRVPGPALAIVCLLPLAAYVEEPAVQRSLPHWIGDAQFDARHVLDRYAVYNGSFRLVDDTLRRPASEVPALVKFIRANSGLPMAAPVSPVEQTFVSDLRETSERPKPYIFLFVIDSLRPDYLSPYNPKVTFTPRIAEFAAESLVARNAVTRYGGTGLSLPAIWSGSASVHKQYVKPFAPMNTLEKLLVANQYRRVMSMDVIMAQLLRTPPDTIELDRGIRNLDYELCQTLKELAARMPFDSSQPVFGYSLPQDLHASNMISASVPAGESYPGFHAPYAARVRRIDRCFGAFVDSLKRGVYDRSAIVVTSDHGEMLGEDGRWGHAYYLFPQILQVPLIIHLPAAARPTHPIDLGALTFTTDIAPTLYAALGYDPQPSNPLMGHSILTPGEEAAIARRRGVYVFAASYSSVYAVVRRNGRRVYIIDAVTNTEYAYNRDVSGAWHAVAVDAGMRTINQRAIREHIDTIRHVYRMDH